jgi:hypothetical protein
MQTGACDTKWVIINLEKTSLDLFVQPYRPSAKKLIKEVRGKNLLVGVKYSTKDPC